MSGELKWDAAGVDALAAAIGTTGGELRGAGGTLSGKDSGGGGPDAAPMLAELTSLWGKELGLRDAALNTMATSLRAQTAAIVHTDKTLAR